MHELSDELTNRLDVDVIHWPEHTDRYRGPVSDTQGLPLVSTKFRGSNGVVVRLQNLSGPSAVNINKCYHRNHERLSTDIPDWRSQ